MHIPDGLLEPAVCAATGLAAASAIAYSLHRVKQAAEDKTVLLTGVTAAMIFAGQMVNFPLALFSVPVSGHLMGGVLAAILLGPWAGCLAMTLVLVVQCLFFSDGGLLSLGANILHMAVLGCWGGYACYSLVKRCFRRAWTGTVFGAAAAAWLTVVSAAALLSLELHWSLGKDEFVMTHFLLLMVSLHAVVGVGEAVITLLVLKAVLRQRPELVLQSPHRPCTSRQFFIAGGSLAFATVLLIAPWASPAPDGLEMAVQQNGLEPPDAPLLNSFFSNYEIPWLVAQSDLLSTGLAGGLGIVVILLLAFFLGRLLRLEPLVAGGNSE